MKITRSTTVELGLVLTLISCAITFGIMYEKFGQMDKKVTAVYCYVFDDPTCEPGRRLSERVGLK